jgi:hypothetical protein
MVMMFGIAVGFAERRLDPAMMKEMVLLTNKLLHDDPNFIPYDVTALPRMVRMTKQ